MKETKDKTIKLNENEERVLKHLAEGYDSSGWGEGSYWSFDPIARNLNIERRLVRLACRSLARKGLAEYARGLFNVDGEMMGAGYGATLAGASLFNHCDNCDQLTRYEYNIDAKTGEDTYISDKNEGVVHIQECEEHYKKSIKRTPSTPKGDVTD